MDMVDISFSATVWFFQILGHFLMFSELVNQFSNYALNFE